MSHSVVLQRPPAPERSPYTPLFRSLCVGVGEGVQPLCALHDELEGPLQELGYRREERRYTPHITLGRVKSDRPTAELRSEEHTSELQSHLNLVCCIMI